MESIHVTAPQVLQYIEKNEELELQEIMKGMQKNEDLIKRTDITHIKQQPKTSASWYKRENATTHSNGQIISLDNWH